jgi:hypothetical protein
MTCTTREPLTLMDVRHREQFSDYVRHHGHAPWQPELARLYELWKDLNEALFDGRLVTPHIILNEPKCPQAFGDHAPISGWGSTCQIRLRPSLLTGTHRAVRDGDEYKEGRFLLVADVLLHETVHQFIYEVHGLSERSYHGHGPRFRDECNRIGQILGLPPVRVAKRRGRDKDRPSCAPWPLNVRPAGYYLGAFDVEQADDSPDSPDIMKAAEGPAVLGAEPEVTRTEALVEISRTKALALLILAALVYGRVASSVGNDDATDREGGHHTGTWVRHLQEAALSLYASVNSRASCPSLDLDDIPKPFPG